MMMMIVLYDVIGARAERESALSCNKL